MRVTLIRDYLESQLEPRLLGDALSDLITKTGFDTFSISVDDNANGDFEISKKHLIKICDDIIRGELTTRSAETIALIFEFSEYYRWDTEGNDGKRIDRVVSDWANTTLGYDLTIRNVWLWRSYLDNGSYNLDRAELKVKFREKGKWLKLYQSIGDILWKEWDPIGVSEIVVDEYQDYIPKIYRMIRSDASIEQISGTLLKFEIDNMGLHGNEENCTRVANLLHGLRQK